MGTKKYQEVNMKNVYVKNGTSSTFFHVAAPTEAMEKSGMETRLFFTVVTLLLFLVSPWILLFNAFYQSIKQENYERMLFTCVSFFFLFIPLYIVSRYQYGFLMALFMTLRGILGPVFFALSIAPDEYKFEFVLGSILFAILLYLFQKSCQPPNSKNDNLRILIIGDALPPKVDGVATFAENSVRLLKKQGHEIQLITSIAGEETLNGCPITRLAGMATPISPGHSITIPTPYVLRLIQNFKPHVVHLFEVSPLNLATFAFCHIANIPVTFSHHTRLDLYINIVTPQFPVWLNSLMLLVLERIFLPLADVHLCVSKVIFEKVKRRGTFEVRFWNSGVDARFDRSNFDLDKRSILSNGEPSLPLGRFLHESRKKRKLTNFSIKLYM